MHVSEMDWTNKNVAPSKIVTLGEEVEVMVLEIDEDKRRISLGMKQCKPNPWEEFSETVQRGDRVKGPVKSITDFGVFVGLAAGIDGLVHLSDLSWSEPGETAVRNYKKGQEVEAIVPRSTSSASAFRSASSNSTPTRSRSYTTVNDRGMTVTGRQVGRRARRRDPAQRRRDRLPGALPRSAATAEDARNVLKEGDEVRR